MDLFELVGKIAVTGEREAIHSLNNVADNAEKNADRICRALDRIGSSMLSHCNMKFSFDDVYKPDLNSKNLIPDFSWSFEKISEAINKSISKINPHEIKIAEKTESLQNIRKDITENITVKKNFISDKTNHDDEFFEKISDIFQNNAWHNSKETSDNFSQVFREEKHSENINIQKNITEFSSASDINVLNAVSALSDNGLWNDISKKAEQTADVITHIFSEINHAKISPEMTFPDDSELSLKGVINYRPEIKNNLKMFDETFKNYSFSMSDLFSYEPENIRSFFENISDVIRTEMPSVNREYTSHLEKFYKSSADKWQQTALLAASGTRKMAGGINSAIPFVISACDNIGNSVLNALKFDASQSGSYIMNSFENGIHSKAWDVYNSVSNIAQNISSIMSGITFADISIKSTDKNISIPEYATGGIVTREHIARVGEDGAEAIIPLEHNTEWIDKVAARMSGSTSNSAVAAKLDEVISLLKNQKIYLDGRTLVGGIANEMDRKLGSMARLKRRG